MLPQFPRRRDAALFLALAVSALALSAAAVGSSLGQVGRVFPGFVVWDDLVVPPLGRPVWTGIAAHVPFRARVRAVDGVDVASRAELDAAVRGTPAGTPHRYVFEDARATTTRTVASMVFTVQDYALTLGVYLLNGLAFIAIGLAVFYLKPEARQSRALLAFGLVWGLMLVLCTDLFTAGRLGRLVFVLEALSPAATLHLALTFPEPRGPLVRTSRPLAAFYGTGLVVGLAEAWFFPRSPAAMLALNDVVYGLLGAAALLGIVLVAESAVRAASPLARRRARVVLAGGVAAFLIPACVLLLQVVLQRTVSSTSSLVLTGFVFPLAIGYAIARHDLFEADRFVKLSLVYAILTALITLGYGATVLVAERVAAGVAPTRSPFFPITFVLLALTTIVPLRERVQRAVDRLLYRGRVDYKDTVAHASERMTTLLERDAIVEHLVSTVRQVLFIEHATVWEHDGGALVRRGPAPASAAVRVPAGDPGLVAFEAEGRPLSRDEVEESPRLARRRDALRTLFSTVDATLLVPLLRHRRPTGLLALGPKASGGPLSADDVDVLRTLANEAAVALANAAAVEQLQEARARLSRAEHLAAIGELSTAVAHGIRNPLAGIRLAAQLGLETVAPADPVRENLGDVLTEVSKLEAQVRGILDFARPFEPRFERTDLRALVDSLLATLASRLAVRGVTVTCAIPPDLPPLEADAAQLGQALQEIVVNALEAMTDGGRLTITAAVLGDDGRRRMRVRIADTGPGIGPEMRERIFQLFMTTKPTGTGVGLAVVRKIVGRHGGTIAVEPAEPSGACFVLELPLVQRATA